VARNRTVLVATSEGLFGIDQATGAITRDDGLGARDVEAMVPDGDEAWAILDERVLAWRRNDGSWTDLALAEPEAATSLVASSHGVFVGTEGARLLRLHGGALFPVEAFDEVAGRDDWYTPWGGPPAVRSIAEDRGGRLHVNVHVGGIPRSLDGGEAFEPTVDVDADVHQVIAHPIAPHVVLAAAAVGLLVSEDGGATWRTEAEGLASTYARAVAVADGAILLAASNGPRGGDAAVYRSAFDAGPGAHPVLERCTDGLPMSFDANIDTGWLVADGPTAAFASPDGSIFVSGDAGRSWSAAAEGLPNVHWVTLAPAAPVMSGSSSG
jgi:hypothetical protein